MSNDRPRNINERNAQRMAVLAERDRLREEAVQARADQAQLDRQQREAEANHESNHQQLGRLLVESMSLTAENPLVGVPTTLVVAYMRGTRLKSGEQALAAFDERRAAQGKASLVPGDTLGSVDAADTLTFFKDHGLEQSWKTSPEAAQADGLVADDPFAGVQQTGRRGLDGPQLG